ncbi:MAG: 3-keto-5-aminohexanoate cleavage protein [Mycobacteriaceae bacterium]
MAALGDVTGETSVLLHGEGTSSWPVLAEAVRRGLDVRIGLEDVLVLRDGSPAESNAQLVVTARGLLDRR